jgi:hypothetical protein
VRITLLTAHFFPELHPRAFRCSELANEFIKRGHNVTVVNLGTVESYNYKLHYAETGVKVINYHFYLRKVHQSSVKSISFISRGMGYIVEYLLAGKLFYQGTKIAKYFVNETKSDMIISISTPFMNHLAIALAYRFKRQNRTMLIADSGDPFSRSTQRRHAPYFNIVERLVYRSYHYLSVPSKYSIGAYRNFISERRIKIIPQGFNFDKVKLNDINKQPYPVFAYAGVFYNDIRNPTFLFDQLAQIKGKYKFKIYLRSLDPNIKALIAPYQDLLGENLEVFHGLERDDLIRKLSEVDFLVNLDNLSQHQIPSKLIDYALTKRPIFSCSSESFQSDNFESFLTGDYKNALKIDISKNNIKSVVTSFLTLFEKKYEWQFNNNCGGDV